MTAVTYSFSAAATIDPAEVNQNFADLAAAIDSIDTSNLRNDAGVKSTQLADRYALVPASFVVVPFTSGATYAVPVAFTMPGAATSIYETALRVGAGKRATIAAIEIDVQVTSGAPAITVIIGGTTMGGGALVLLVGRNVLAHGSDPVANPQLAVADLDVVNIQMSGGGTCYGVTVTIWLKEELVA